MGPYGFPSKPSASGEAFPYSYYEIKPRPMAVRPEELQAVRGLRMGM